jgi:hypothetical protein
MKKQISAILIAATVATAAFPSPSFAVIPVPPAGPPPGGGAGGAGGAGGIIGVAAFFVIYDLIRRTTCSGDFLYMGGPGFTTKIKTGDTILTPPRCIPPKRAVVRARG